MISKDNLKDLCPLTPMQEGMLYQSLLDGNSTAYHEQLCFTLAGALNPELYRQSWELLVARHEVLRSVFIVNKTQQPLQAVLHHTPAFFTVEDWAGRTDAEQKQAIADYLHADLAQRFKLVDQPPFRVKLFDLGGQRWCLVWSFHHILLDGWSVGILMAEMGQLYAALQQNTTPRLAPTPPFSAYLQWLKQQDPEAGLRFWQTYLDGYAETASLPACGGWKPQASEQKISLPAALPEQLQACAQRHKVTVNALVQAAWGLLLGRYTNRQDVVFATVVSGRPSGIPQIERMVGLLINAVPVRVSFAMAEPVSALLARLHQHNTESQAFQFLALADVQPQQGSADHLLVFENYHLDESVSASQADFYVSDIHAREETHYDLTLVIAPGTSWTVTCLYNEARYSSVYIQQVAQHFINLLVAVVTQTDEPVQALAMLSAEETARLLAHGRGVANTFPEQENLACLFEKTVQLCGTQTALMDSENRYSFVELNAQANRMAHGLIAAGVKPGDIVAVALPRGCMRVIAVLALIKAGAAYLGIEADTPEPRIAWLCQDAGVRLIIIINNEAAGWAGTLAHVDPYRILSGSVDDTNPSVAVTAAAMAYISYTSGSTGEPKGVCVSQRNISRLVMATDFVTIGADDVFLQFAPLSFDASTFEIWAPLLNGVALAVEDNPQPGLAELGATLKRHQVSILWLTAGLFHQMVDGQLDDLAQIRQLLAGGDVVSPDHVKRLLQRYPGMVFVNGYGPTENTTFSCCHRMTEASGLMGSVPIGQPIANSEAWVLDKLLRPQPIAAVGELYVGGAGVALGYWQQPALTAAVFVPHPYGLQAGERLYRTGDLVSLNAQGQLEFIGRADSQFKIRGFRIEAQEVESALKKRIGIKDALAHIVQDASGDKALVAYVVTDGDAVGSLDAQGLGEALAQTLPRYLIPDVFVELAAFPLNKNGKVDRMALPDPFASLPVGGRFTLPDNDTERALQAIWQRVLNRDAIGVTDDFFRLGGHSLKATQVVSLIRKQLNKEVPLRLMFEAPTIRAFAEKLQALAQPESNGPQLVKRDRSRRKVL
ncbi:MAG: amino acid adenylation domain-containing protein [Methylovulum sp.]|nr:amino acid adenylation domain-containing protein [Methylovulum sp.]